MQSVFRFAPSPNGHLHLGHAYSALLNAQLARDTGGQFIVRIEDIDTLRCPAKLVADCLDDLEWLGLVFEQPVLRQSRRFEAYADALATLWDRGLLYGCRCTRSDLARAFACDSAQKTDPDGAPLYPGTCRGQSHRQEALPPLGQGLALRLDMHRALALVAGPLFWEEFGEGAIAAEAERWGDAVLARKDVPTSYHLAVVVDDAFQGVSDVVRGRDLYSATGLHRLLQHLLGLPAPRYRHHTLLTDPAGLKLAKSRFSQPLRTLRADGVTPKDIRKTLGFS